MDLRLTDDEIAFRDEVRSFVRASLPASIRDKIVSGRHASKEDYVRWTRILFDKGWAVPHWPKEWGGTGWDPIRQSIFLDEIQRGNAPEAIAFGVSMVGPVIYTFGSQAQKERFLPRIADLRDWWCQGFSEPGAGSDLAGLRTSARKDGDSWVISGQKTWTTMAQYADWIFVLARTNPQAAKKQEGISFFLADMKTPGITVRPIQTIDGGHEVNEVFFDDVRIPADAIVGSENKGWDYAKFLLSNERNGIARVGISKARLDRVRHLASLAVYGAPKMEDPFFRAKLASVEVELKALEMTQMRVISNRRNDGKPDPKSSVLKIKGSEIQQATTELLMEVVGPYALPYEAPDALTNEPPVGFDWAGPIAPGYFNQRKVSIYGGSNEIQRGIIAKAILGL
jgi:pimeloyl-CoA dehydrogenase large subunit